MTVRNAFERFQSRMAGFNWRLHERINGRRAEKPERLVVPGGQEPERMCDALDKIGTGYELVLHEVDPYDRWAVWPDGQRTLVLVP